MYSTPSPLRARLERAGPGKILIRRALAPLTLEGFHVPRGSLVCVLTRESHRDPMVFDDPHAFRPARFLGRTYSGDEYSPFGIDQHQCLGRALNLRVGTLFVEELIRGFAWSVVGDGPRCYGQYHWQPSHDFAIDVRRAN